MTQYIEINKTDLTLAMAWMAAVFAYYAWKEASTAAHRSRPRPDPITVGGEPTDEESSEDVDD
ncbi:hypothetical protein GJ633_04125 [Halorubrum sp. CBA1125]|uniref:hypothetical protein n=1 Tax=Halorubrum sp. CBA1125 TaxID=2668072 RepID=UPI0012E9622B|nr:hypothetical protein [Halorubrum sp. CBA1125]MUW13939.1 hypothetical protein [Halorubrum sp. CBA1125]